MKTSPLSLGFNFLSVLVILAVPLPAQEGARLTGTVRHAVTGALLNGAAIDLPQAGRSGRTDENGRFDFVGLPPGEYAVTVTYIGLDPETRTVRVGTGASPTRVEFRLKSDILLLETVQVTAEASGHAAAITRQKNAANALSAAATDAFGSLANQNPGEVFMRLPGVTATVTEDNEVSAVAVRGIASSLNAVTMDGGLLAPVSSAATRQVRFTTNVTAQFEEFEVVKGITPDMDASSIGGTLNMKTRSPLNTARGHEFNYRFGARWAPPFAPHNPMRRDRPLHPDLSVGYQGVFSVLGGDRNLGVAVNANYFESVGDYLRTIRDYQSTNASPAYLWSYQASDYFFNRHLETLSGRVDFQWNEYTRLSLRGTANDYTAFGGHQYNESRALTGQTVAALDAAGNPTGTGAILPNYTDTRTEARAIAASQFQMLVNSIGQLQRQRTLQLVGEHKRDRWQLNTDLNLATGVLDQTSGQDTKDKSGGSLTSTISGVGWILDMAQSREFPRFTQTGGPSVYDINNYRSSVLTQTGGRRAAHVYAGKADARYELPVGLPAFLKAGISYRRQDSISTTWNNTRYTYAGPDGVVGGADDSLAPFYDPNLRRSGAFALGNLPFIHIGSLAQSIKDTPARWVEDVYYRESQKFAGTNRVYEDVSAAYGLGQVRAGRLTLLGGVRVERTEVEAQAWVINRTLPTIANPVQRAAAEYAWRTREGSYSNTLPSLHLTYTFQPRLIARASYSTGIARPQFSNLIPTESVNDTARTVTMSNPGLQPQTAENWDLSLEYYFRQLGLIAVGVFQKDLDKFIFTSSGGVIGTGNDNGFNGQYSGYTVTTQFNGGRARIRGLELNYQQQVSIGPKWVRGFGIFGNYTRLNTRGDYGTGVTQAVSSLAEFVPTSWNAGVRYAYGRFRTNLLVNHTGEYLFTYNASAARLLYKRPFRNTTLSLSYAFRPSLETYIDAYNLFNEPQRLYYGVRHHLQAYSEKGMILSFGVRGRF
ncbi:MAG: TonB-dependent receptor [Verrucomicrobia bacterium]|nr:TonB-dependent receptor [Verrucomicrobiota bacterium]